MAETSGWVIYHNPRCSKSRAALAYLRERGIEPEIVEYLKTPPDASTLRELLEKLDILPRELVRTGEDAYKALKRENPTLDDEALLAAMVEHPILIQRPIIVHGERAVIGRPTETIDELFEE